MKIRFPVVALFILASTACMAQPTVQQKAKRPAEASVLLYSDQSPGALPHSLMWQRVFKSREGGVKLVTDPAEFVAQLPARPWSRVIVVARYAPGEPSYARALRAHASAHPDKLVEMFFWHDNGTRPTPDTAVLGTTATVLWNHGMTTIGYAIFANKDPEAGKPQTLQGYQFPSFRGIEPKDPTVVAQVPAEDARGRASLELIMAVITILTQSPCELECWTNWCNRVGLCNAYEDEDMQRCDELYGGEEGDPEKWTQCMEQADKDHSNCMNAALNSYKGCMALCKKEMEENLEAEEEQPEAEQGGGSASTEP